MFKIREEADAHMKRTLNNFINASRANGRYVSFEYARGPRQYSGYDEHLNEIILGRGDPEGAFFVWEDENGNLHYGWSVRHSKNEPRPYSRIEAVYRAFQRSGEDLTDESIRRVPDRQRINYLDFIERSWGEKEYWHKKMAERSTAPQEKDEVVA